MTPKILIASFFIILTLAVCKNQKKIPSREIYNQDFKWHITIPEGFDTVNAEQWRRMQERGAEAIEKTYEEKVETNATNIFIFKADQFNYFESNYQPFDTAKDGDYNETFTAVNQMLYGTFEAQMPGTQLDSSSSSATISGLNFRTFHVTITFPDKK